MIRFLSWNSDSSSIANIWNFAGHTFMLTENRVTNMQKKKKKDFLESLNLFSNSFITTEGKAAFFFFSVHRTMFIQCIKTNSFPITWAAAALYPPCTLVSAQAELIVHQCSVIAEQWVCAIPCYDGMGRRQLHCKPCHAGLDMPALILSGENWKVHFFIIASGKNLKCLLEWFLLQLLRMISFLHGRYFLVFLFGWLVLFFSHMVLCVRE